jgi:hypothetical protein
MEHNIVIVDGGGWPANDRPTSAGDDCSTNGLLVGLGLGHLADYVRGDARESYRDNSIPGSCPALRADRTCLFVKQGMAPYLLVVDDIQQTHKSHDYDWQWYSLKKEIKGAGSLDDPATIEGQNANCSIAFFEPSLPALAWQVVEGGSSRRKLEMGLLKVRQRGSRVRYIALVSAWEKGKVRPAVRPGPEVKGNLGAVSLVAEGPDFSDLLVWQPEEVRNAAAPLVTCGNMVLQGYLALVRRSLDGGVMGYVLGDGGRLSFAGQDLVRTDGTVNVSADAREVRVSGKLQTRLGDGPAPASAKVRLPAIQAQVYVDGIRTEVQPTQGLIAVGPSSNK